MENEKRPLGPCFQGRKKGERAAQLQSLKTGVSEGKSSMQRVKPRSMEDEGPGSGSAGTGLDPQKNISCSDIGEPGTLGPLGFQIMQEVRAPLPPSSLSLSPSLVVPNR